MRLTLWPRVRAWLSRLGEVAGAGALVGGLLAFGLLRGVWPLLTGSQSVVTPAAFAAVPGLLAVVAGLASLRPAVRAATIDPTVALRHD